MRMPTPTPTLPPSSATPASARPGWRPIELDEYATRQAVEDLDVFRRWLGADRLHLYGESYGTQFVQTYAAAHPDAVAALIIDGPVDMTLSGTDYWAEGARAFEEALLHTLDSCTDACAEVLLVNGLLGTWDTYAEELARGPLGYQFTRSDGTRETRELTLGDLETATAGYVYSTFDRMLLQRAVAYAAHGELAPMARLAYVSLGQDPDTLEALVDPTWSDALYYAVECMDYAYGSEDDFLEAGEEAGVDDVRLGSIFYGDLPCSSWPVHPVVDERPAYLTTDAYPDPHPGLDDRPGNAVCRRAAALRAGRRWVPRAPARRAAHHLRPRQSLPR